MASREYSARLGTLSDEQLQAALDRFGLGRLVSAEPVANGLFGQNLMLETSSGGYVFRGAPHWNTAGEDDWQFQKERFFSRLVHESGTGPEVPWPYLLCAERDIFGWGFALQPRLPGGPLTQPMHRHYSPAELIEQSRELGVALGKLHTVKVSVAGAHDASSDSIAALPTRYADYVRATIDDLLERSLTASKATSAADVAWAHSVVEGARGALALPFQPTVVHLDYGFHNTLWNRDEQGWQLTGVVDWHTSEAGHPESDLARPLATDMQYRLGGRAAFLVAYHEEQPSLPGFEARFPVFMLWERLLIWQYWQARRGGFREGVGMREWMEPFVRILD